MITFDIPQRLDEETARNIKSWPQHTNRASTAGHPCVRYLVACRLCPDKKTLHGLELQRIFDEGNLHEEALLSEIKKAGFKIREQQRAYEWKNLQLTGRIDAKVAFDGSEVYFPLEIKSCSPNIFPSIKEMKPEDMIKSKYSWVRKYPAQILLYCMMEGQEEGLIIFKNKTTGEKCQKVFKVNDNLEYLESVLKKLEAVNDLVKKDELPPVVQIDDCKRCEFAKTLCFPDQDYGPGFSIMSDEEVEAKLVRREDLQAAAKEFEEIDKEIKEQFRGKSAIVGDWKIESRTYETTSYDIPKEIKAPYAIKKEAVRVSIERLWNAKCRI